MESNETNPNTATATKNAVLEAIRRRNIRPRPKLYFTLKALLIGVLAAFILIVTVAIFNFILFTLRVNGHEALLSFGLRGIYVFLLILPWPLIALDALLIVLLEFLLRRFRFGYRSPVLYLLIALIALALSLGFVLDRATPLNDDLFTEATSGNLPPPFGELYRGVRVPAPHDHGIYRGTILSISTSTLSMKHDDLDQDADESVYTVELPYGFDPAPLSPGDFVYVAGDMDNGVIHAYGIQVIPNPPPK